MSSDEPIRVADLFCGGGGCSAGLAQACEQLDRRVELAAVNHDADAIATHEANHPWADHYHSRVEGLKPIEVFPEGDIEGIIAAPSCTDYSKARGGQPITPQDRMAPFAILDWVAQLRPRWVLVENVPEFRDFGPVVDGQPTKNGRFFDAWRSTLGEEGLGYTVADRVLTAADYGDPTTRKRLFVVARRDDAPVWPAPTHAEDATDEDDIQPWRSAAEIIDWSERGQSIWTRGLAGNGKRPLSANTMDRIAQGLREYGVDALEPFADALAGLTQDEQRAMQDGAVSLSEAPAAAQQREEPFLVRCEVAVPEGDDVQRASWRGLCPPFLKGQHGGANPRATAEAPALTVTTDGYVSLYESEAFVLPRNLPQRDHFSNPAYDARERPLHTVTAQNHDGHLVTPYLVPYKSEREGQRPRTHDLEEPFPTVTATGSDPYLAEPYLVVYNGQSDAADLNEPLPTVTTRDRFGLVVPEAYPWGLDVRYRMLQPRELAGAQGFPEDYQFKGDTKKSVTAQIGNAVPVNLATALCKQLLTDGGPTLDAFGGDMGVADDD